MKQTILQWIIEDMINNEKLSYAVVTSSIKHWPYTVLEYGKTVVSNCVLLNRPVSSGVFVKIIIKLQAEND